MADYTRADLKTALDRLPLERGDVVFCHSNIGMFGRCEGLANSQQLCEAIFEAIMRRIGPGGAFCVPTFTYSFQNGEEYNPAQSPSKMGMLAEWVRRIPAQRSADACYSVAAIGDEAVELIDGVSENSFDQNASFFARFEDRGGKVLNLNFDAGSTFVHWVERHLSVPYRFDKTFEGVLRYKDEWCPARSTIFVRYLDDALEARFEAFDALAREQGKFVTAKLGRGEMGVISAEDAYNLIAETLPKRPWFLTKAEAMGAEPDPAKFSALR